METRLVFGTISKPGLFCDCGRGTVPYKLVYIKSMYREAEESVQRVTCPDCSTHYNLKIKLTRLKT